MLRVYHNSVMGKVAIKEDGKKFILHIVTGNCLAVFIHKHRNENNEKVYSLCFFYGDKQHCKNMAKDYGEKGIIPYDVTSIELNLAYSQSRELLPLLVKNGYKVKCYYKEPKRTK